MAQETALLSTLLTTQRITAQVFDRLLSQVVDTHIALLTDARTIVDEVVPRLTSEPDPEFDQIRADLKASLYGICARILTTSLTDTESAMKLALEQLMAGDATAGRVVILNPSAFEQ
jgi:hypothetical protein